MNKALPDTDLLSEIGKGFDPTVAANAAAYRQVFGRYTTSTVSIMEIIRGFRRTIGRPIGLADPMIAATALTQSLELVTGNTAHFQQVQHLGYPLVLASWRV